MGMLEEVSTGPVLVRWAGPGIVVVSLNRPEARNAVNAQITESLARVVDQTERDTAVAVVILASTDARVFCAGADLKEVAAGRRSSLRTEAGGFAGLVFSSRSKPWIAAVEGYAVAGGFELVLACDMVVASETARFGLPEVKRGIIAGAGGLYRLPRVLPRHIANELIATGDSIDAQRGYTLGLVNRLVPAGASYQASLALAQQIAGNAPVAVRESLQIARRAYDADEPELRSMSVAGLAVVEKTRDYYEGARAFIEKRDPVWQGE